MLLHLLNNMDTGLLLLCDMRDPVVVDLWLGNAVRDIFSMLLAASASPLPSTIVV
jgi:hypothetical protein